MTPEITPEVVATYLERIADATARCARILQDRLGSTEAESAAASAERTLLALRRLLAETPPR